MGTPLLTINATMMCAHGGKATVVPSNLRVKAGGNPVVVLTDMPVIAGCAFTVPPGVPTPCVAGKFMTSALRVKIGGIPAVLTNSQALTTGLGPPVPVTVAAPGQVRASGT